MALDLASWLAVLLRFTHVVAAIMWIGNSLLFTWMELNLVVPRRRPDGAPADPDLLGTLDMLHGGGVFHLEKKVLHPHAIPDPLHWFMWQSYTTWITGFVLLLTLFAHGGGGFLLDATKTALPGWGAILLSLGGIFGGWLLYDTLWRSPLGRRPRLAIVLSLLLLIAAAALFDQFFNGRALWLQIGAMLGTMMSANVFFHIIRNQRRFMASLRGGQSHDLALGKAAKLRSLHNHYMTFPVVFLMLSAHFPQLVGAAWTVPILAVVIVGLMVVKHLMNLRHRFRGWLAGLVATVIGAALLIGVLLRIPALQAAVAADTDARKIVIEGRALFDSQGCAACHLTGDLAPKLEGLFGHDVVLEDGGTVLADAAYLRASIVTPAGHVVRGFAPAMPPYAHLEPRQLDALVAYIESLGAPAR